MTRSVKISGEAVAVRAVVASGFLSRMRGLLGTKHMSAALLLVPARQVHTIGMRYSIDAVFLAASSGRLRDILNRGFGEVKIVRTVGLRPWKVSPVVFGSQAVLEVAYGQGSGFATGDILRIEAEYGQ